MKPFLAQGALIASERLGDDSWVAPIWDRLRNVIAYREKTQYDPKWGLFFWDNAMQSGADNNVALTNDPSDRGAILAADLCAFQLREYGAKWAKLSRDPEYRDKEESLRAAMLQHLWFESERSFFNVRRDSGEPVKRIGYSNFVPLIEPILPEQSAQEMIRRYLWNPDHMLSAYGLRSLSKQDPDYNNVRMIDPYSNWQGPIWINANYLYFLALKRYGFEAEVAQLAAMLGRVVLADIQKCGSMHENYDAETGEGLAPESAGFVGWNLLVQDMLSPP